MSRPNTRNKNKRNQKESENSYSEILRKIYITGEIEKSDIRQLYSANKPICQGCRINSKENPNCFCALIPPNSSSTRKTGLWQKNQDQLLSLGPNPSDNLRATHSTPAGLTNLGATCYANSILQCLYMNTSFRAGIFSLEPGLTQYPVLGQLARLFAQLCLSKMGFIDSAPFIKTLELDNGVQQDSHEFLTLFLSLLERSLNHSRVPSAKTVVQDLFRGTVSHVTRCSKCGKDSEASSNMEAFYELELNIKDLKTLNESLEQYLSIEELQGDNQYFCDSCNSRVDATRCIKLRSLPTVLNLQLKRYVFLPKTTTRKKITSSFNFPRQLNMTDRLTVTEPPTCNDAQASLIYELSAILIHKGTTVNSGHYVAHIKDESTGLWWEFDDEQVSELGPHPFGEKEKDNNSKTKHNNNNDNNGLESDISMCNGKNHHEKEEIKEKMFSSNDCYMLMYKRTNVSKENGTNGTNGTNSTGEKESGLPSYYCEEMEKLNEAYEKECEEYQRVKEEKLAYITERREEVKSVLSEAPVEERETETEKVEDIYFWISADWLRQWADNVDPPPLDNSAIICEHGKVPVSKINSMKRISAMAWQLLHSKYGGGPALSSEDCCVECLKNGANSAVNADMYREQKASFKELAESALAAKSSQGRSYFVSRAWLVHWLRRKNTEKPCDTDVGPTSCLACPHGGLLPEQAAGAKRVSIPESLWLFLYETYDHNKTDMDENIPTFPSDLPPCDICSLELSEVASVEDNLRATKNKLRQNHEKLTSGKSFALNPEKNYNLVPAKWLADWRGYVTATGKNISSFPQPDNLESALNSFLCHKHSMLIERPLELICKRSIITQKVSSSDGFAIIPEADWLKFCEEWKVPESKGISCQIAFTNYTCQDINSHNNNHNNIDNDKEKEKEKAKIIAGSSKEEPIPIDDNNNNNIEITSDDPNDDSDSRKPFLMTHPQVCEECIGEKESCILMEKLNYQNENISVYFVRGKDAPKSIQNVLNSNSDPERRTSKRSRKSSYGNSISLTVSGSTTLYQLKMMIWEAFGVVKENQKLHKGSAEIEGDTDTLADKNIFPGDVLWVKDSEIHENRDIADELSEEKVDAKKVEEGFRGTLLTSDISNIYGESSQN